MVFVNILLFAFGLIILVKGSDFLVKSAASISKKLGISEFVVGLTLVALGTSIPELASAIIASIKMESGLVMGNIVGANIADIGLVTGLAAAISVIRTNKDVLKRDGYIMLFAALVFYIFMLNKIISRIEAILLLFLYFAYILFLYEFESKVVGGKYHFRQFMDYFFRFKYVATIRSGLVSGVRVKGKSIKITDVKEIKELFREGLVKDFLIAAVSIVAVIFGANYFVSEANFFAELLGVPEVIIGVSLMSIGTTLPELSVTVAAARKGFGYIALGNAIGSSITNILLIIGISAFIHPLNVVNFTLYYSAPFMIFMGILLLAFIRSYWRIRRVEGIVFLVLYVLFLASLFFVSALF
ncbi:calcium/sodium antiporter [Candidatus Woesearchaeota archaeon]|nr:calcium/sodium antiporter [Candidatus Woesearchaeota archaeon]